MLLLRGGRSVDPSVVGHAEFGGDLLEVPAGILAGPRGHLRGEQAEDEPVLSVVHTVPSLRRKLPPALSSPPKQQEPSSRPGANHLNPTGTSSSRRPRCRTTRSMRLLLTSVLPTAELRAQRVRCVSR